MPFFLIFLIIPLIEIGIFIEVGGLVGIGTTLLLCLLTAVVGAFLIRIQGIRTLLAAQASLRQLKMPLSELFDGICLAFAGALLLTPGFFTDMIGFLLLVPKFRGWLRRQALPWVSSRTGFETGAGPPPENGERVYDSTVIEGEYEKLDPDREDT